jgi:hypothetical protein
MRSFGRAKPSTQPARAVVAAATTVSQQQLRSLGKGSGGSTWQEQSWEHYDLCGEFRFGANWIGNVLSRARLFAAYVEDTEDEPVAVEDGRPAEIVADMHGGAGGQSQMLKRLGVHLSVPGESFVVTWPETNTDDETGETSKTGAQRWATLCGDEISEKGGTVVVTLDGEEIELPEDHVIIRVWRPHPRKHWEADSPGRGLLPVLHELERLTARVLRQIESRLAGSGVLFVPDSITFPVQDEQGNTTQGTGVSEFIKVLAQAMIAPITDQDSASAVVPIIAQAPPEAIEAIKHLAFSTELDEQTIALREAAIRRLALGLDMPPEVLLGLGDTNHWSAWEVTENAITQHVEPLLQVIVDGLTANYFQPALQAEGVEDWDRWVIAFDTSELVNRPNRGPDALQLYDRGELGGEALRREHGFNEGDAPTATQRRQRDIRELLKGAGIDSDTATVLMELLGYVPPGTLPGSDGAGNVTSPLPVPSTRVTPPPAPAEAPRAIPARPDAAQIADTVLASQVVAQYAAAAALEYAGKRLLASDRSYRARYKGVPHHELHTHIYVDPESRYGVAFLLDGAFRTFDTMPELAPIRDIVEQYVTRLLVDGVALDRESLNAAVEPPLETAGGPR